jgi:predicted transcriptional regulator
MCYDASACVIGFLVSPYSINQSELYLPMIGAVIMVFFLGPAIGLVGRFMQKHIFKEDINEISS